MPRQFVLYFDTYNMQIQHCMLYVRVCVCVYVFVCVCVCAVQFVLHFVALHHFIYGVATVSRIDKSIGLFCRIMSLL